MALFGIAGVLGKLIDLPAPLIVLGRVVFASLALLAVVAAQRAQLRVQRRHLPLLVGQGVVLAVHWTAFFQSIVISSVAIGVLSFATFPLFTVLLEPALLGARPARLQVLAAVCILGGVALLVPWPVLESGATQGVAWGLLGAATFALLSVLNRSLGAAYPSVVISLYQDASAVVALLPAVWLVPLRAEETQRALVLLVVLGVVCTAVAHTLFIASLRYMTAVVASLFASLEPVWGILFAIALLGEVPTPRTLVGGAIIVGATLAPALRRQSRP